MLDTASDTMRGALDALIEAHATWLRRHALSEDAESFLYHYDALTCLWRQYHHMAEQGKRADELWREDYEATHGPDAEEQARQRLDKLRAMFPAAP